jgi:hypothetical protein
MNKDILFYSEFCEYSQEIKKKLSETGIINNMIQVCVDDEQIKLPPFLEAVPTIYIQDNKSIVVDDDILNYINSKTQLVNKPDIGDWDSAFSGGGSMSSFASLEGGDEVGEGGGGFASIGYDFSVKQIDESQFKKRTMEDLEKERALDMPKNI